MADLVVVDQVQLEEKQGLFHLAELFGGDGELGGSEGGAKRKKERT